MKDLTLEKQADGKYSLTPPSTELEPRLRTRFTIQFLSQTQDGSPRGSLFATYLAQGKINTNADINSLFSLASVGVVRYLQTNSQEITPQRTFLTSREFTGDTKVALTFDIYAGQQTVTTEIVAG